MPPPSAARYPPRPSPLPDGFVAPVVGVAGVGLIGGSIALRSRELGWDVVGWDHDPAAVDVARRRGALTGSAPSLAALAGAVDTLVLAGPVDVTLDHIAEVSALSTVAVRASLILDVGSVKAPVARAGFSLAAFVPTHPIAGSERSGPAAARADLFAGCKWAYDPGFRPEALERARRFIVAMGAEPLAFESSAHDALVALTSHLPQTLSVALGARFSEGLRDGGAVALTGTGMRSMLRLAASSFSMWRPVLAANAGPLAQEVRALAAILTEVASDLERGDTAGVEILFGAAAVSAAALRENDDASNVV